MDLDQGMIERAQQQYPEIPFFQGDIRSLQNWADQLPGKVDTVFSNAALHWIPKEDSNDAIQTIASIIRPGGRFIAELGGKGNVDYIVRAVQEVLLNKLDMVCPNPWYFPSIADYSSLLERHGIEVTLAALFDRPTLLEDGEQGLSNWIRMFGNSFLEGLSENDATMVLASVNDKLRSALFDGEQWTADYRRLRIIGRKLND
jgi:trans-aconitate 2-methyltransferase